MGSTEAILFAIAFGVAAGAHLIAWVRLVERAFGRDWRWGLAVLLGNWAVAAPSIAFLHCAHLKHQRRYTLSLLAPYAVAMIVAVRALDWVTLAR